MKSFELNPLKVPIVAKIEAAQCDRPFASRCKERSDNKNGIGTEDLLQLVCNHDSCDILVRVSRRLLGAQGMAIIQSTFRKSTNPPRRVVHRAIGRVAQPGD